MIFSLNHPNQILDFFQINGYVVIKDVLTQQECQQTTLEMEQELQKNSTGFSFDNPNSYHQLNLSNYGLPGKNPVFTPQLLQNRTNPLIHQAFQLLYQTQDRLIVNHDRFAFYRPTLNHPEWKTPYTYPNLHLDMDPKMYSEGSPFLLRDKRLQLDYFSGKGFLTENNLAVASEGPFLQGLISIWDNQYYDGGLQLVPGFNYQKWYSEKASGLTHPIGSEALWNFNASDKIDMKYLTEIRRISMPAGSIAIWNKELAHGSVPNNSSNGRLIQFIVMQKRNKFPLATLNLRSEALSRKLTQLKWKPDSRQFQILF